MRSIFPLCLLSVVLASFCSLKVNAEAPLVIIDAESWLNTENQNSFQSQVARQVLSEFKGQFDISIMPRNRARQTLERHPSACSPWMLKNKAREKLYAYTLPYMMESSLKLVLSKESAWGKALASKQDKEPVSLFNLLVQDTAPVLGIESGRSYGDTTDALLKQLEHSHSIYVRTSTADSLAPLKPMLHHGFIDVLIEYDKINEELKDKFYILEYQETEPFQLVYFACSKTEQVKPQIQLLNDAIRALSINESYINKILSHLPEKDRAKARAYWQQALGQAKS
ncbi:hypothetical protein [Pseudoalteromonas xiamenensis]